MTALAGGHIDLAFDNMTLAWPQAQAGTIRALAVTSAVRSPTAPNVPTVMESLPGFDATSWHGVFAPAGTPPDIVGKLTATVLPAMREPSAMARLIELGNEDEVMTGDIIIKRLAEDKALFAEIVEKAGIVPQ